MAEADGLQDISNDDSVAVPAGEPARPSVAETLRAAREAAGLDIKQLSALTRVTSRHLEALESGDLSTLPGRPYALGFARSYARAVGLDEKAIGDAMRGELDRLAPAPVERVINQFEVGDPAKTPSRLTTWLAAGLVLAIALAGLVFWRSYYMPSAELPALIGPQATQAAPAKPTPAPAAVPAAAPTGPVVFTATEDRIWVKFYDGQGQQLLQKQLSLGESWTVPEQAQNPMVWTGRPDALTITIGGQPVPRLAEREGIVKDVPVSAAALLARAATPAAGAAPAPAPAPASISAAAAPRPNPVRRAAPRANPAPDGNAGAAAPAAGSASAESAPPSTALD
ncbi:MAG: helix-turn-helix domain-containing protein [Novosphingobium sp.]